MSKSGLSITVMFSGGRDSSLAACLMARNGYDVHLLTTASGLSLGGEDLVSARVHELRQAFTDHTFLWSVRKKPGLLRKLVFADIESDFARFRSNLLVLGSQLASLTEGILYCREHEISTLVTGYVKYQAHYLEQSSIAVSELQAFCRTFDVDLRVPVYDYESVDAVKYDLLNFGISTKSLESVSLLADSPTTAGPEQVREYIASKQHLCRRYVDFVMSRDVSLVEFFVESGLYH